MSLARTRIVARLLAVAALAALTAGCFQPMYAEHAEGNPSNPGLREKLMGVDLPPAHRLVLKFQTSRTSLMTDPATALPTSEDYGIDAQFNLIEIATNKSVMTGTTFSRVSYDIPGSYQRFARARAFRDAEDRACQEIAEHIQTRLASFFYTGS